MSQDIFKKYPALKIYYKTADGQAFFLESDALNHAKSLKDKNIDAVQRSFEEKKEKSAEQATKKTAPLKNID